MAETGSGIEGMASDSAFARFIAGKLSQEDFRLLDIGCAAGLAPGWRAFGDRLAAVGIDVTASEIDRLNAGEQNPKVIFHAGYAGPHPASAIARRMAGRNYQTNWAAGRLAYERHEAMERDAVSGRPSPALEDYLQGLTNNAPLAKPDLEYSLAADHYQAVGDWGEVIDIATLLRTEGLADLDVIKIDVDGPDFLILRSLSGHLSEPTTLGVPIEVNFVGSHDANDNTFHNIDRLMREKGFDLFGLSVRQYAAAALPWPYMGTSPAETLGGRPMQGDAIYLRDLASPVRAAEAAAVSAEKLLKLSALFALFGAPDSAAEMLLVHRARMEPILGAEGIAEGLEILAQQVQADDGAYAVAYPQYVQAFERREPRFFDIYGRRNTWMDGLRQAAAEKPQLAARIAELEARNAGLTAELEAMRAQTARMPLSDAGPAPPRRWLDFFGKS